MNALNRNDIIRMAREAGWPEWDIVGCEIELERFAALVAAAEREEIAKTAAYNCTLFTNNDAMRKFVDAIRARGQA